MTIASKKKKSLKKAKNTTIKAKKTVSKKVKSKKKAKVRQIKSEKAKPFKDYWFLKYNLDW